MVLPITRLPIHPLFGTEALQKQPHLSPGGQVDSMAILVMRKQMH
jgi:hypothetical protein